MIAVCSVSFLFNLLGFKKKRERDARSSLQVWASENLFRKAVGIEISELKVPEWLQAPLAFVTLPIVTSNTMVFLHQRQDNKNKPPGAPRVLTAPARLLARGGHVITAPCWSEGPVSRAPARKVPLFSAKNEVPEANVGN